jgi:ComEC/Rec2-related protein
MIFVLSFSLAIALITITQIPVFLVIQALLLLFLLFFPRHRRHVFGGIIAVFLALLSREYYQHRHPQTALPSPTYIGSWIITQHVWSGRYLYQDESKTFLIYKSKPYAPGDKIWLVAYTPPLVSTNTTLQKIQRQNILYSGFNQQKRLKMKGYDALLYHNNSILLQTGNSQSIKQIPYLLSKKLEQTYSKKQTAWLVLGMLIGDKSSISASDYQLFINSGLVHLVAVSGGNIVMLVAFLTAIFFFIPFYPRVILILICIVGYGILCGMDSSVLRAVVMGGLSLLAILLGRGVSLRRLLAYTYIGMLLYNPYFLVYDVGFLLSFSAVIGIVFLSTLWAIYDQDTQSKSTKKPRYHKRVSQLFSSYILPSLGATLGIFPVIIFFMGKINIGSIIGNMFVLPIVPLVMIGGFLNVFMPSYLQKYFTLAIDALIWRIYRIAQRIDAYGPTLSSDAPRMKYSLLWLSTLLIIWTVYVLTEKELARTNISPTPTGPCLSPKNISPHQAQLYDDIIEGLAVEAPKNPWKTQSSLSPSQPDQVIEK